jgi:hypothetical protein
LRVAQLSEFDPEEFKKQIVALEACVTNQRKIIQDFEDKVHIFFCRLSSIFFYFSHLQVTKPEVPILDGVSMTDSLSFEYFPTVR